MKYHPSELCHFSFSEKILQPLLGQSFDSASGKRVCRLAGEDDPMKSLLQELFLVPTIIFDIHTCSFPNESLQLTQADEVKRIFEWLIRGVKLGRIYQVISETSRSWFTWKKVFCVICGVWSFIFVFQTQEKSPYETVADVPES